MTFKHCFVYFVKVSFYENVYVVLCIYCTMSTIVKTHMSKFLMSLNIYLQYMCLCFITQQSMAYYNIGFGKPMKVKKRH